MAGSLASFRRRNFKRRFYVSDTLAKPRAREKERETDVSCIDCSLITESRAPDKFRFDDCLLGLKVNAERTTLHGTKEKQRRKKKRAANCDGGQNGVCG